MATWAPWLRPLYCEAAIRSVETPSGQTCRRPGPGARAASYLEEPARGHPARSALLVLGTQQPQLLRLAPDSVGLKEVSERDTAGVEHARVRAAQAPSGRVGCTRGGLREHTQARKPSRDKAAGATGTGGVLLCGGKAGLDRRAWVHRRPLASQEDRGSS